MTGVTDEWKRRILDTLVLLDDPATIADLVSTMLGTYGQTRSAIYVRTALNLLIKEQQVRRITPESSHPADPAQYGFSPQTDGRALRAFRYVVVTPEEQETPEG